MHVVTGIKRGLGTLDGYIGNTTVAYAKADNSTCYFRTFWDDTDRERGELSWHIWAARVLYLLVFEHVVYLIKIIVVRVIPDIPAATRRKVALHDHVSKVRHLLFAIRVFILRYCITLGTHFKNVIQLQ